MFRALEDFVGCWTYEADATLKVLAAVPDSAAGAAVAEGHRDLKRMAWHLVESVIEMPARMGLEIEGKERLEASGFIGAPPATMAEVAAAYSRASESLLRQLRTWTDATLLVEDEMYGERWKRGQSLFVLVTHQVHHRGQMTVLMRQAGLTVPGIYGPAKEGWKDFGMEAPKV